MYCSHYFFAKKFVKIFSQVKGEVLLLKVGGLV